MAYQIKSVTIRTDNTMEGMNHISELWQDITNGNFPLLFDSDGHFIKGISPVSKYSNYDTDEYGEYDLSVIGVTSGFFQELENGVSIGKFKKYDESADDLGLCAKKAWEKVWNDQKTGVIQRTFSEDFESTVPVEYTKDGKAHCYLYIAVNRSNE